ncbi:gas vesicle protein [Alphaproteobacteria bacterium GH1-50]|uniref:Gas vesicle protein n=1 Tax=Kangsaoukella pontilimi TaxID=2691042 RepID=A0A7C9IHU3_9RHOB|nr:gas vesicle protein [Kangsaoukella pontilimi]
MQSSVGADGLADVLERILDKGVVIAGDVAVSLVGIELLTIRLRLLIATVDKAREIGIDWWENDPMLSSRARGLETENRDLLERVALLEDRLAGLKDRDGAN